MKVTIIRNIYLHKSMFHATFSISNYFAGTYIPAVSQCWKIHKGSCRKYISNDMSFKWSVGCFFENCIWSIFAVVVFRNKLFYWYRHSICSNPCYYFTSTHCKYFKGELSLNPTYYVNYSSVFFNPVTVFLHEI